MKASPWIQTRSGLPVDLLDPKPEQVELYDICFALAGINRFTSHARYTVATHSYWVGAALAGRCGLEHAKWGLLHDASEAYLGDVASPLKSQLPRYAEIENRMQRVIYEKLCGAPRPPPDIEREVKEIDLQILADEQATFMPNPPRPWGLKYYGQHREGLLHAIDHETFFIDLEWSLTNVLENTRVCNERIP